MFYVSHIEKQEKREGRLGDRYEEIIS